MDLRHDTVRATTDRTIAQEALLLRLGRAGRHAVTVRSECAGAVSSEAPGLLTVTARADYDADFGDSALTRSPWWLRTTTYFGADARSVGRREDVLRATS